MTADVYLTVEKDRSGRIGVTCAGRTVIGVDNRTCGLLIGDEILEVSDAPVADNSSAIIETFRLAPSSFRVKVRRMVPQPAPPESVLPARMANQVAEYLWEVTPPGSMPMLPPEQIRIGTRQGFVLDTIEQVSFPWHDLPSTSARVPLATHKRPSGIHIVPASSGSPLRETISKQAATSAAFRARLQASRLNQLSSTGITTPSSSWECTNQESSPPWMLPSRLEHRKPTTWQDAVDLQPDT
ncbi:hypothetical protein DIPPA_65236 [Diplonema papillatum]|nr:hypothetical protein DIPPA_65237 [Diplonema papillatum]KAJ9437854.1 hypothetical protein DIPPA_65236 [Diplonema papillatum]